jgi:hypothetical protein
MCLCAVYCRPNLNRLIPSSEIRGLDTLIRPCIRDHCGEFETCRTQPYTHSAVPAPNLAGFVSRSGIPTSVDVLVQVWCEKDRNSELIRELSRGKSNVIHSV